MSAWERSRYIPWSKIPQDGSNLESQKERIFRELQKETTETEQSLQNRSASKNLPVANGATTTSSIKPKIPFSVGEALRQAAFGGCIGTITGSVFGFLDSMRSAQQSTVLEKASTAAKGKFLFQGTTRSATLFGVFFAGFHATKYGIRVAVDPGEFAEIALAGGVSMGALVARSAWRPSTPYAAMLIIMDSIHILMREFR